MYILEAMQWIKTRSVSWADFFHDLLEQEEDTSILLPYGVRETNIFLDWVHRFVTGVSKHNVIFNTSDYDLPRTKA